MRTIRMGTVGYAAAVAALSVFSLQAQSVQASLAKEAGALSEVLVQIYIFFANGWVPVSATC